MVIGLEEPVLVKGIGEIIAKVDSGNGGYNVIHGEDLMQQGDILAFLTVNKDGDERRVSKKIKTFIDVNIGGGHVQHRPVVELDVQIGGKDYKKIPFSVTNRKDNDNKILISKDFVGKELKALIDVTKKEIADDNIEVDYVTEGVLNKMMKGAGNLMGKAARKAKKELWDNAEKNAQWVFGDPYMGEKKEIKDLDPETTDEIKAIKDLDKMQKEDAELIKKTIGNSKESLSPLNVDLNKENIEVSKILDYLGNTPNPNISYPEGFKEKLEKALKTAKSINKKSQSDIASKEEKQQGASLKKESVLFEADQPQPADASSTTVQNDNTNKQDDGDAKLQNNTKEPELETNKDENIKDPEQMSGAELQELFEDLKSRNRAIFYVAYFKSSNEGEKLIDGPKLLENFSGDIDNFCRTVVTNKKFDINGVRTPAIKLAQAFNSKPDQAKTVGLFALCTGKLGGRKCELIKDSKTLFNSLGIFNEKMEKIEKAKELYNTFNQKFKEETNEELTDESYKKYVGNQVKKVVEIIKQDIFQNELLVNYIKDELSYDANQSIEDIFKDENIDSTFEGISKIEKAKRQYVKSLNL